MTKKIPKTEYSLSDTHEKQRVYFVIDMKSFFASVECAERGLNPFETNLVVADPTRGRGGVCLAITPKMKSLGVRNRCRLYEIPPGIEYIIAPPQMKKYIDYAAEIYGIYLKYIDKDDIHVYSIDEAFIDATDYLKLYHIRAKDFAVKLMKEIDDTLHVPSSAGIGTNMYLAKIALDITAKHSPDRIGWLNEEKYLKTLLDHTPITDFWQVASGTAKRLSKIGITTMRGIINANEDLLYNIFGINAELLIDHAHGVEPCTIADIKNYKSKSRSLSSSQILPCNYDFADTRTVLSEMVQSGCYELIRQNFVTSSVVIFIGYGYSWQSHEGVRFSVRLKQPTNLYSEMLPHILSAFDSNVDRGAEVRKVAIDFGKVTKDGFLQRSMFVDDEKEIKEKNLLKSIVKIQEKFGKNSLIKGIDLGNRATQIERNKLIGGHRSGED